MANRNKRVSFGLGIFTSGLTAAMVIAGVLMLGRRETKAAPAPLNLTNYRMAFSEEFDGPLDVSAWGPGTRWIAHTPWHGDFGDAAFADPAPTFPFTVSNGVLRIEARRDPEFAATDGAHRPWRSGLLASNDPQGRGFSAKYGYFEISAKLPTGEGVWPAFWLGTTTDKSSPDSSIEIDVMEYYGAAAQYEEVVHVWRPGTPRVAGSQSVKTKVGDVYSGFHKYGVMVTPNTLTFYFDRQPVWELPTPVEHKKPLMVLLNLALGAGFPIDKVPSPTFMYVDYVRVYAPVP